MVAWKHARNVTTHAARAMTIVRYAHHAIRPSIEKPRLMATASVNAKTNFMTITWTKSASHATIHAINAWIQQITVLAALQIGPTIQVSIHAVANHNCFSMIKCMRHAKPAMLHV